MRENNVWLCLIFSLKYKKLVFQASIKNKFVRKKYFFSSNSKKLISFGKFVFFQTSIRRFLFFLEIEKPNYQVKKKIFCGRK